jgi:hypothetical protein
VGTLEKELWDLFVLASSVNRGRWSRIEVNDGKPNSSGVERYQYSTKVRKHIKIIISLVFPYPLKLSSP